MALAILEPLAFERTGVRFRIDTGTNKFYQLKVGKSVERRLGDDWVDDVFFTTPMTVNASGMSLINSTKEIIIPAQRFESENPYAYIQLFTFKSADRKSPAFSPAVKVPRGFSGMPSGSARPHGMSVPMNQLASSFNSSRSVPCRSYAEVYSHQASVDDLLAGILKLAGPVVSSLFGAAKGDAPANGSAGGDKGQANVVANLLNLIVKALAGNGGSAAPVKQQSLEANRFTATDGTQFSRPFIFGIDDALLGSLLGPVLQILPQLVNSATQQRIQLKQADNKLTTDVLSEVNRRMLMEQLIQAKKQAPAGDASPDDATLDQLIQKLQQTPAATGAATAPSVAKSLSLAVNSSAALSSKITLSIVTSPETATWNGQTCALFSKSAGIQLKVHVNAADPVPKKPLAKAILRFVFKDTIDQKVLYEKKFKQKDVAADTDLTFAFPAAELQPLPVNRKLSVLLEMRWLSSTGQKEYKALGSTDLVFVGKYFVKDQGKSVSPERELSDIKSYRPFWNKIWESPSLDAAKNSGDDKKLLWELDVNTKYSVLLSAEHSANGLMSTKILRPSTESEGLTEKTEGRMKAGIELSISELNKLLPLWNGETVLDGEKLGALNSDMIARKNGSEFTYHLRLKGRAAERGMIWVIPIFKLFSFTLGSAQKTDESGQIVDVKEENVRFPIPVSARVIGLKSQA